MIMEVEKSHNLPSEAGEPGALMSEGRRRQIAQLKRKEQILPSSACLFILLIFYPSFALLYLFIKGLDEVHPHW